MELIVRPFQTRNVTPPTIVPGTASAPEPVSVTLGGSGSKTFRFSYSESAELGQAAQDSYKEIRRTSKTIKITNPDDEDQFVEFKRAEKVTLANTTDPSRKRSYKFTYPDNQS